MLLQERNLRGQPTAGHTPETTRLAQRGSMRFAVGKRAAARSSAHDFRENEDFEKGKIWKKCHRRCGRGACDIA
jgi:hypothetical protein